MYNPTDKSYLQARAIKKNGYQLAPENQAMVDWISERFQVKAIDFNLEKVETSKGYKLQRIYIILEREEECERMEKMDRTELVSHFKNYFTAEHGKKDQLKNDYYPATERDYPEMVFGFNALESIEVMVAYEKADTEIRSIQERFPDIWSMSKNWHYWTVFYYTDQQWKDNESNGTTAKIKELILAMLKKHDTFGLFGEKALQFILFDTKQNLDENYQGNMYYYYK